ncbi:hypothetical protein [Blautia hydrogenotrophica]|uniref:hypothetical protein n=1 Tax=Blautia hydrogenotrophica TaxID=53443 RepID=UPI0011DCF42E|nr:hypothetical protein [Blautia hydrogenotrophica]MCT6797363.1 hypothetical protein [Blautia hydrogenotrophica]
MYVGVVTASKVGVTSLKWRGTNLWDLAWKKTEKYYMIGKKELKRQLWRKIIRKNGENERLA